MTSNKDKNQNTKPENDRPWGAIVSIAVAVALGIAVAASSTLRNFLLDAWSILTSNDENRINEWTDSFGVWGPLVIILLMILQMFLFVVPSWLLMVVAVLAYGPWWGGLLAIVAVTVASSVGYGLGNVIGEHGLERIMKPKTLHKVEKEAERYGIWAVVVARINPLLSNDAISLVGGLIGMGYWKFIAATLAGILPLTIMIAAYGSEWQELKPALVWVSVISLAGLVVKVIIDRRADRKAGD